MFVALRRHSFTRNGCNSGWDKNRRHRVALGNGVIDGLAIVRTVCRQRRNVSINQIKQVGQFGGVTDIIGCQFHGDDFMRIGIDTEMQLAPSPTRTNAVLLIEPFAFAGNLQSRAVDQQMQWLIAVNALRQDRESLFGIISCSGIVCAPSAWRKREAESLARGG